jgi:vancomycin resistance protein VanW
MLLSDLHPAIYEARVAQFRLARQLSDRHSRFAARQDPAPLPYVLVRHSSVLRRKLGNADPRLQETKIVNLGLAAGPVDGLVMDPDDVFSFWNRVGAPSARRGFVDGLVLARGQVRVATGGGLCQLSNLLYWMALHAPLEVVEHHRHGFDAFPDHRRVLPFGSGATVFYNYGDLRLRNATDMSLQLRVWLTDTELCGEIRAARPWPLAYHVHERGHRFVRDADGQVFRENEIWRRTVDRTTGRTLGEERITTNRALVTYDVPPARLGFEDLSRRAS